MCVVNWEMVITPIACMVRATLQHFVYHKLKVVTRKRRRQVMEGNKKNAFWSHSISTLWGKCGRLENSSNCEHVDFPLHLGKELSYFFLFFVEYMGGKHLRECRINEKNKMTERIKSQVAWLSKFKCSLCSLKMYICFVFCFLSLGYWSVPVIYSLLLSTVFA